jgi:ABC-type multidrug transport system ATPase subunit
VIRLNGVPLERDVLRKISGFVPQQDLAIESLTVKEHMEFMVLKKITPIISEVNTK